MGNVDNYDDPKNKFIHNSFLSSPSGHSGFSMSTFIYLSLLLYEDALLLFSICNGTIRLIELPRISGRNIYFLEDRQRDYFKRESSGISPINEGNRKYLFSSIYMFVFENMHSLVVLSLFLPLCISIYIGVTRIYDFFHHVEDVLLGWVLGAIIGVISFFYIYKSPSIH